QVNDYLEFHFSKSFKHNSMSKHNWLTMLYKNLLHRFPPPKITGQYSYIPSTNTNSMNIDLAYRWIQNKRTELVKALQQRLSKQENNKSVTDAVPFDYSDAGKYFLPDNIDIFKQIEKN